MHRVRPLTASIALLLLAGLVLLPLSAVAAGGTLEIMPDFRGKLWLLIALFVVLIWPANALLWRPLLGVIDERARRIEGTRARSAEIGSQADDVFGRYQEAVGRARGAAETDTRAHIDAARREQGRVTGEARRAAEASLQAARADVEQALGEARGGLRDQARELARVAASRALGRELS